MKQTKKMMLLVLVAAFLASCGSIKEIAYFQGADDITQAERENFEKKYDVVINPNDNLLITVNSINPEAVAIFNLVDLSRGSYASSIQYQGYLVDQDGFINFPVIGKVNVGGLTKKQAIELLEGKISQYIERPTVNIRFMNFKVSVLGEVTRPGSFNIEDEKITILEALSRAGDMTIYGKRDNVLVIREKDGVKEFARINLKSVDLFTSPYYYLQQNDVVYVQPNKAKASSSSYSSFWPLALSGVSTLVSVATLVITLTRK